MISKRLARLSLASVLFLVVVCHAAFAFSPPQTSLIRPRRQHRLRLFNDDRDEQVIEEEQRLEILQARRDQVRSTLKSAEALKNFRIRNGFVPKLDQDGQPIKSDSKVAVSLTAFVVAAGAIALRIGGRAALVSAVGLDFLSDNPELKDNLEMVLTTADSIDPGLRLLLFTAAWTAVKCLCFDAGGVVLALASGILFGGILQGAVVSAAAATVGSSVAFGIAKLDTPVRKKALEILDEYPSLRGIEKVVARDGFKAILTLRLAPILPIPLGMYNYIYGVTNVGLLDLVGGIFLGSLKPYLLDSFLGVTASQLVDGSASDTAGLQDILLLVAVGVSVLIGVFASQLAGETWDSVLQEVEDEKKAKDGSDDEQDDEVTTEFMGWNLPKWAVGFQYSLKEANERIRDLVEIEYEAKVWNYTKADGGPPATLDPAANPMSPEVSGSNQGVDLAASLCDGLVLSPIMFEKFLKYSDPLHEEDDDDATLNDKPSVQASADGDFVGDDTLSQLGDMRSKTEARIAQLNDRLKNMSGNP